MYIFINATPVHNTVPNPIRPGRLTVSCAMQCALGRSRHAVSSRQDVVTQLLAVLMRCVLVYSVPLSRLPLPVGIGRLWQHPRTRSVVQQSRHGGTI